MSIDWTLCPECGGKVKIIAAIEDSGLINKILTHLGLPTRAPQPWTARGPPNWADDDSQTFPDLDFA
jgi:hypothetical protein